MSKRVVYEDVEVSEGVSPVVPMTYRDLFWIGLVGIGVGLLVGVVYWLLDSFVFGAVLCRPQSMVECGRAPQYSMIVATVIGAIGGLVALARLRTYRPLFVVIFAAVALGAMHLLIVGMAWFWAGILLAVLYALAYALFAWMARIRSFILALVIGIVLLVLLRWFVVL